MSERLRIGFWPVGSAAAEILRHDMVGESFAPKANRFCPRANEDKDQWNEIFSSKERTKGLYGYAGYSILRQC